MRLRPVLSSLLTLILLALCPASAWAQTVLGKSTADKFAAAFWAQNTNADSLIYGLNGFGHGMLTNVLLFPYVGGANITVSPNPDGTITISGTGGGGGGTPIGPGSNIVITVIGGSNYLGVVPRFTNSLQAAIVKTNIANGSQLFQDWTIFPNGAFDSISYVPHAATYSGTWWAGGFNAGATVPGYTGDGSALTGIPVTALSLAGAANGNVPTVAGGVWTLATPSAGSGLALTDTNQFAGDIAKRSLATTDTNNFANNLAKRSLALTDTNHLASDPTNGLAGNLLSGGIPVTALQLAGAVNGNVPTYNSGVWGLATPSGSGLALTDTNQFAGDIAKRSLATTDTNAFAANLFRRGDTNTFAASFTRTLNNGIDFADTRQASSNLNFKLGDVTASLNPFENAMTNRPLFERQGLINGFNDYKPWIWMSGKTNIANGNLTQGGDYRHAFVFPAGIDSIGDTSTNSVMDPTVFGTTVAWAFNSNCWNFANAGQDIGFHLASGNTFGSGTSLNFDTVITNGNGMPIIIHSVDASLCYVSTNSTPGLLPGYMYIIENISSNTLGFGIGSTVVPSGMATGNYMQMITDPMSGIVYFPIFTSGQFSPEANRYPGFRAISLNNNNGAIATLGNVTGSNFVTSGVIDLSDVRIGHFGANGGDLVFEDSGAGLFAEVSKNMGFNLRGAAGQVYSWNNSSQLSNAANGTVALKDSSGNLGILQAGSVKLTTGAGASKVLTSDASGNATWQTPGAGSGTVTSVSGDGVVTTGTITTSGSLSLVNAAANTVLAGPTSGGAAAPSYQTAPTISGANITALAAGNITVGGTFLAQNANALTNYTPDINSPNMVRTLWHDGLVSLTATNVEQAISSNTLPANLFAANGNSIDYWVHGTNNNAAARTITWYVYYGSSKLQIGSTTSAYGQAWEFHIRVARIAASVVDVYADGMIAGIVQNVVRVTDTGSTASAQPLSVTFMSVGLNTAAPGDVNCRFGRAQFIP